MSFLKIHNALDLNKFLQQIKLQISLAMCAPISVLPSNLSTLLFTASGIINLRYTQKLYNTHPQEEHRIQQVSVCVFGRETERKRDR